MNRRWNTESVRHKDVYKCDECGSVFQGPYRAAHATSGALTFCGSTCNKRSRSSGVLAEQWRRTKLERYGVEHSSQVPGASNKMLASRVERYGTTAPVHHHPEIHKKWANTMQHRHGAQHPLQAPGPKAKRLATVKEKFGMDPLAMPENRKHLSEAGQKGYRTTAKRIGSWILSKPEIDMVKFLRDRYGDVDQQAEVDAPVGKRYFIDAYVKSLNTYVQLDGEFWHGLDKPYDQLHENGKKAYDHDRIQDTWFLSLHKTLIRITDKEFLACQKSGDFSNIVRKLGG